MRTAYAEVPPRVEYTLAPLGRGLHEIVTSLIGWAADHHDEIRANRERAATTGS
ncbi:winged helix-turn-helix transcriptional regulator [Micromonospora sp. NPDC049107]|uniref:winged helix-turn-helix transcriptional regulator n=1 Tax=unclassified Micromonospora TaxID=2617518 RepID=UPI0033CE272D